ncbi:MAG: serine hydrolase domain-containing protein [Haloarculaceae archaeon]
MPVFEADGPEQVRQLFEYHLSAGLHHGGQLAVFRDGECVVDCAGGVTGPDGEETRTDTRHVLFSSTKPLAGVCLHQLAEAGDVAYDDRVVDHWPGFDRGDPGKAAVTVEHVLSHQAGLPLTPADSRIDLWNDWERVVDLVEEAELRFEPGSTAAYHALSYGWLVGELVRRVSGQPIADYAREHVFEPLEMANTSIGLREGSAAELVGFEPFDRCRDPSTGLDAGTNAESAARFNQEGVRRAVVPAATGIGTARDLARFYACLANGGELDGARVLDPETVARATTPHAEVEHDGTLGGPRRYGLGFVLGGSPYDKYGAVSPPTTFGHGGLGSSVGWGDAADGYALAYVTNGIRDEYEHRARTAVVSDAVRDLL